MNPMLPLILAVTAGAMTPDDEVEYAEIDYAKIDRKIATEPTYIAAPRYALFVFGLEGKARMWAVIDKSDAELPYYDVLYLDLDTDGDLTDDGERFQGTYSEERQASGTAMSINVGDVPVPGTLLVHRNFRVSTIAKKGRQGVWFQMLWDGDEEISGGYGVVGTNTTVWSTDRSTAPILRPTPLGPLTFALYAWGEDKVELTRGKDEKIYVMVGNAGSGPDTLAVLDEDFLDLEEDELTATLIGRDASGREIRSSVRLKQHC